MEISTQGYWVGHDPREHKFDVLLANAIVRQAKSMEIRTIKDIGCGQGLYVKHFNDAGFECYGFDGNPDTVEITPDHCMVADFAEPISVGTAELIISLEVGEHIPIEYENIFINNLVKHTEKVLILSWAVPDQGGYGHVNCRDNDYIITSIESYGLKYSFQHSTYFRTHSKLSWFKNTIMVFIK